MWPRSLLKSKSKALAIHASISALIFIPLFYLIWFRWFPPPLFFTDGGWQGVRIMVIVDMVIGPTLTFLIFNPMKSRREIVFDLSCIAAVQAVALVYGFVRVESQRIQAVAFDKGFYAVTRETFAKQEIAPDAWSSLGDRPPYWVYVRKPQSKDEKKGVFAWEMTQGVVQHELHFLYEPMATFWREVASQAVDWTAKDSEEPEYPALCQRYAASLGNSAGSWLCLPLRGYFAPAAVIFDPQGRLIGWEVGEPRKLE